MHKHVTLNVKILTVFEKTIESRTAVTTSFMAHIYIYIYIYIHTYIHILRHVKITTNLSLGLLHVYALKMLTTYMFPSVPFPSINVQGTIFSFLLPQPSNSARFYAHAERRNESVVSFEQCMHIVLM